MKNTITPEEHARIKRRRWRQTLGLLITVLVLVLAEGLFLYYSYNDLYGGVERAVENRFSTVVGRLQATGTAGDTATTAESRANVLRRVVEQFDEKDKFEFMLLDTQGVILATSSGTMNRDLTNGTDYGRALTSANGIGSAIFTTPQGERVMAVTMLVPYAAGSIAALRMVTSLTLIDGQWWRTVAICVGLGVLVLAFTVWSGLFFVRSIVRPLGEVEATATKIAKGDMKVRLPDTRYDDEIGRLCKTINQMAEDLAETTDLGHHRGRGDGGIEVDVASLDLGDEVVGAHEVGASLLGGTSLLALGEDGDADGLAGTVGQSDGATDVLVGLAGVDAEAERGLDRLVEAGKRDLLDESGGLLRRVELASLDLGGGGGVLLTVLRHVDSSCGHRACALPHLAALARRA